MDVLVSFLSEVLRGSSWMDFLWNVILVVFVDIELAQEIIGP